MVFERVQTTQKTGGGTENGTPSAIDRRSDLLARSVKQWLPKGLSSVEVLRHCGRVGFRPCGIEFVLLDDDVADVEGVTIRGVNPVEFARSVIDAVLSHAEENEAVPHYSVVGIKDVDGDEDDQKCFVVSLPAKLIRDALGDLSMMSDGDDAGALIAGWRSLASSSVELVKKLSDTFGSFAESTGGVNNAGAEMLMAHAKAVGEQRPELELEMARMAHERERTDREVRARAQYHRQERGAEVMKHGIDVLGPSLAAALATVAASWAERSSGNDASDDNDGGGEDSGGEDSDGEDSNGGDRGAVSPIAARIAAIFEGLSPEKMAEVEAIIGADDWPLIVAAREAKTDSDARARIASLDQRLQMRGEAKVTETFTKLARVIGPQKLAVLADLITKIKTGTL